MFDERATNGVTVLMGGGATYFLPPAAGGTRKDGRDLVQAYAGAGYDVLRTAQRREGPARRRRRPRRCSGSSTRATCRSPSTRSAPDATATNWRWSGTRTLRDQPMLADMTALALASLAAHSPRGFYLMVEGASIDKQAHESDADRTIWDTIEFDNAVQVALDFARRTNGDADPANDTLVVVTADHESGGFGIIGVGNERYAPSVIGRVGARLRRHVPIPAGADPQLLHQLHGRRTRLPRRSRSDAQAAARLRRRSGSLRELAVEPAGAGGHGGRSADEDGGGEPAARRPRRGQRQRRRERHARIRASWCRARSRTAPPAVPIRRAVPTTRRASPLAIAGHTASDVPLSAEGPGAWQFTGVYENTDVFLKLLRAAAGSYAAPTPR